MKNAHRASLKRRFASYIIDLLILFTAWLPVFIWFVRGLFSEHSGIFLLGYSTLIVYGFALFRFLYLSLLWRFGGTLAERFLHIRVTGRNGLVLSLPRCLVRALTLPLDTLTLGLVFLTPDRCGLHDRISGSEVLRSPRKWTAD